MKGRTEQQQTIERSNQEFLFGKYQSMLADIKIEVKSLQAEHLSCKEENAGMKREIEILRSRIADLERATGNGV